MEELTPEAVGVAARLGTAGEKGFGPHRAVVAAVAVGQVRVAPADVEKLGEHIGQRLASRAVWTRRGVPLGNGDRHNLRPL